MTLKRRYFDLGSGVMFDAKLDSERDVREACRRYFAGAASDGDWEDISDEGVRDFLADAMSDHHVPPGWIDKILDDLCGGSS